jgi:O-antigen/teichoic acid export membrane protein
MLHLETLKHLSILNKLEFLAKDTVLYGAASAFHQIFALITIPIITRYFSVSDYGIVDFYIILSSFLVTVFIFGQDSAVARFFHDSENVFKRRNVISQALLFQFLGILIFLPILWIFSDNISNMVYQFSQSKIIFQLVLTQIPFMLLVNFSQNILKLTFNRSKFLIITLGLTLTNTILLVVGILFFKIDIADIFVISLITYIVFGLLGLYFVRHWLTIPENFQNSKHVMIFAIPFGIMSIIETIIPAMTRWLVNDLLGAESLGLFAVGMRVASIVSLYAAAFRTAWGPLSLAIYKEVNVIDTYNIVLKIFTWFICGGVVLLLLVADWVIILIASENYILSWVVVPLLVMGLSVQAISWITEIGISLSKKSYLGLYGYLVLLVTTFGLIHILAPIWQLYGVAIALMLGYIFKSLITSWISQKAYKLNWQYKGVILFSTITLLFVFFGIYNKEIILNRLGFVVGVFLIFTHFFIGWVLLFDKNEHEKIKTWVVNKLGLLV